MRRFCEACQLSCFAFSFIFNRPNEISYSPPFFSSLSYNFFWLARVPSCCVCEYLTSFKSFNFYTHDCCLSFCRHAAPEKNIIYCIIFKYGSSSCSFVLYCSCREIVEKSRTRVVLPPHMASLVWNSYARTRDTLTPLWGFTEDVLKNTRWPVCTQTQPSAT